MQLDIIFQLIIIVQIMNFYDLIWIFRCCRSKCIFNLESPKIRTNYVSQTLPYKVIKVICLLLSKCNSVRDVSCYIKFTTWRWVPAANISGHFTRYIFIAIWRKMLSVTSFYVKENVISRLATFVSCWRRFPRGEFQDDEFENVNINILEFKKLSYYFSNLPLEENIYFNSIIIPTIPL